VVGLSDDIVAVDKPAGVPVHTAGQYRKNTVLGLLQACRPDLQPLLPTHRLDRPVSGLLLLARSAAAANRVRQAMEGRDVAKTYLARVQGALTPGASFTVDVPLSYDARANHVTAHPGAPAGSALAAEAAEAAAAAAAVAAAAAKAAAAAAGVASSNAPPPAAAAAPPRQRRQQQRLAAGEAGGEVEAGEAGGDGGAASAKPALTEFTCLHVSPDGATSVVECRPRTGRTHQLRVHLAHVGHPIANDTQYGGTLGSPLAPRLPGKRAAPPPEAGDAAAAKRVRADAAAVAAGGSGRGSGEAGGAGCSAGEADSAAVDGDSGAGDLAAPTDVAALFPFRVPPERVDALCAHCPLYVPSGYPIDLEPLWLHCLAYAGPGWSFAAPPPAWAAADWRLPPRPGNE